MSLRYTDRSKNDVESAFSWYELQRRGLGFEFLDCVEESISAIARFSEMYEKTHDDFRRCVVRRFPFSVFYSVEGNDIVIHAVFDNRQDPKKRP